MKIFSGKRYFIYGDGVSGRAAKAAIIKNGGKAKIYSDREGRFCPPPIRAYDGGVISPGIKPSHPVYEYCRGNGIKAVGEIDIALGISGGRRFIGITGTNGKTTVTRLLAAMTGGVACGNIGYPASAAASMPGGALVCELSSFMLYTATVSPDVAIITNIATDHLDWHGSVEEYHRCKCNIARNMTGGTLILGDATVGALSSLRTGANVLRVGTGDCAYIEDGYFCFCGSRICRTDYFRLNGAHNEKNALCAIAAAKSLDVSDGDIVNALSSVALDAHRIQTVGRYAGKTWIDDSKGTNVSATLAAVAQVSGSICLLLGGRSKGDDFTLLFNSLDSRVTDIIVMGEAAQKLRDAAVGCGRNAHLTVVDGLADAVRAAGKTSADTVLLSPACASFDEFGSYIERGEAFNAQIRSLWA